jgi:predicted permease
MVKHAFRRLVTSPVTTAIALVTLALGIGVNTAVFSIMDAFLLRALPYPHPDRIAAVVVHREDTNPRTGVVSSDEDDSFDGASWQILKSSLDGVTLASSGWGGGGVNLRAGTVVRYLTGAHVSAHYFEVLGIPFLFGRGFSEDEDRPNGPPVVVLSYMLWQSTFHSDPGIIGKSIQLKGEPYTVVGILARNALTPSRASLFTPLQPAETGECAGTNCSILLRLKPGATWTQIDAQLGRLRLPYFTALETKYHRHGHIYARPLQLELAGDMRDKVIVLMLAVSFILLIACANLAGLALVRILRRSREIATRFALGASRPDVIFELWMEDVLVALLGGAAGVGLAFLILNSLQRILPDSMLPLGDFSIDARALVFTLGAALLTSLLFGALPSLQIRRFDLGSSPFAGSRSVTSGSSRLRQLLIGAEVALTVVLLASAGLLVRTLLYLETLPPGFDPHDIMTAQASLDDARYHDAAAFRKLVEKSVAAMRQIPGVRDAAVGLSVPYERGLNNGMTIVDGKRAGTMSASSLAYITPGYFSTLRIPLLAGRFISDADGPASQRVAIVNVAFGRRFFDNPSPIGFHFKTSGETYTIAGVVGDVAKKQGIERSAPIGAEPVVYLNASQTPQDLINIAHLWFQPSWIVRTSGPIQGLTASMQRALADADPSVPFSGFHSMDQILAEQLQQQRMEVVLLAALASLALLLSAVGIYALVSNLVVQRTREIGIRIALGSTSARAMVNVGAPGVVATVGGLAAGIALAFLTMRVIASEIYGVSVYDPVTFISVPLILVLTAGVASLLPALRISRIQPSEALRAE